MDGLDRRGRITRGGKRRRVVRAALFRKLDQRSGIEQCLTMDRERKTGGLDPARGALHRVHALGNALLLLSAYIGRPLRLQMPERNESAHRRRVLRSYLQLLPAMVRARRAAKPSVDRTALMSWQVTK